MKKFEEEVKKPTATGLIPMTYRENVLNESSKAVQENYTKNAQILREHKEYIEQLEARLKECEDLRIEANNQAAMEYSRKCEVVEDRAELKREITDLKSQLEKQQPDIPEFVAEWIKSQDHNTINRNGTLVYEHYKKQPENDDYYPVHDWITYHFDEFLQALIYGYTFKEKRFYLKHKLTGQFLAKRNQEGDCRKYFFWNGENPLTHSIGTAWELKFTQKEINSMETGSYEQIEVEE